MSQQITAQDRYAARVHYNMCYIGGFMGACTVYGLAGGFGNGWTGNRVAIITNFFTGNYTVVTARIIGLFVYMSSIVLFTVLSEKNKSLDKRFLSLVFTAIAGIVLAFLPDSLPKPVGLYPTFFAMSFQWNCFPGAYGFSCSSIFNTNNFRQFTIGFTQVHLLKNESHRLRLKFYGTVLLSFHLGVITMCVLWLWAGMNQYTSLFVIPVCLITYLNMKKTPTEG